MAQKFYRVTSFAGVTSDYTDKHIAEKELQALRNNGKNGTIRIVWHYLPGELQAMADRRRKCGAHPASDHALMVLLLMETETHANNYCASLEEVLNNFPTVDRAKLETELNKYI